MANPSKAVKARVNQSTIGEPSIRNEDELAYAILSLARHYGGGDIIMLNGAVGALESAKQELFRTDINPKQAQRQFESDQ
jgi:hypothetical protein